MGKNIITNPQEFKDLGISVENLYTSGGDTYVNIKVGDTSYSLKVIIPTPTPTITPTLTPTITPTNTVTPTVTPTVTTTPGL